MVQPSGIKEIFIGSSPCPDEKGTESIDALIRHAPDILGSSPCPDEKGTESRVQKMS